MSPTLLDRATGVVDPHRFRIGTIAQSLVQRAGPLVDRTLIQRAGDASQETSEPSTSDSKNSNTGTIIGAIVVGAALLLVIGGFLLAWRQRNSRRKAEYMAADTGDAFDDGDHYDMDVQRAADDGVRGFRMYGQRGRGYGEGGSGHDAYDDPYDAPAVYDTHGYDADAPPKYDAKYDARGRPISTAESGKTLFDDGSESEGRKYNDGAELRKVQSDETIHVAAHPADKEEGLR
ncbi:hypothetical protein FB107DRAFT_294619 [Schizophyllum commune]